MRKKGIPTGPETLRNGASKRGVAAHRDRAMAPNGVSGGAGGRRGGGAEVRGGAAEEEAVSHVRKARPGGGGSRAFEEGELGGAAMAGAFRGEVGGGGGRGQTGGRRGEGTDRGEAEPRRRLRRYGGGFEDEAVGFFNYVFVREERN
jgi:hypothetical protein